jgi:hypothetical protein
MTLIGMTPMGMTPMGMTLIDGAFPACVTVA